MSVHVLAVVAPNCSTMLQIVTPKKARDFCYQRDFLIATNSLVSAINLFSDLLFRLIGFW